jgi:hypothetical protein
LHLNPTSLGIFLFPRNDLYMTLWFLFKFHESFDHILWVIESAQQTSVIITLQILLFSVHSFFKLSYYCCTGMHLQNLLQYIIIEFNLPHYYPLSLLPHSWNSFNRSHFSIFIYEYVIFPPYSPFYTFFLYFPPSYWYEPPVTSWSLFLKKKDIFVHIRQLYRDCLCGISMYICIIIQIGSSPSFFSFLP